MLSNSALSVLKESSEKNNLINLVRKNLKVFIDWNYERDIIQIRRDGKEHSLKFIEATLLIKLYAQKILLVNLEHLSIQMLEDLVTVLRPLKIGLQQFSKDNPANEQAPESEKVDNFLIAFDAFNREALSTLYFIEHFGELTDKEKEQEEIIFELRKRKSEATDLLNSMKHLTQKAGIAAYSTLYKENSEEERKIATKWFWGIVGTVGITLSSAVALLFFQQQSIASEISIVQFTVTKVVIISCLFLSIGVCFKNYRAHKHNELLNLHKSNALATFDALVKTQMDEHTKNSMLLAVTNTIFGNVSTGFNSVDNTSNDISAKVFDIITKNKP